MLRVNDIGCIIKGYAPRKTFANCEYCRAKRTTEVIHDRQDKAIGPFIEARNKKEKVETTLKEWLK